MAAGNGRSPLGDGYLTRPPPAPAPARLLPPSDCNVIISCTNAAMLGLGRFVFLPYQRRQIEKQGLPVQNGVTNFAAGDERAAESRGVMETGDPAGFTLIDTLAWGSLGHVLGYIALASFSAQSAGIPITPAN